ncbi:3'-5'-exodeoxyribonuclease NDAI_0E04210 [Naumovozyma dairenensis CBS 421]|uniref:Uncharacterized protein n=1 Tax=Naumovozyma dairenensis (strain ATCC 10597 / BCRC 20456 / CBS 421 / NBRC 0211 / NRRL Y-12639) TaxID=1071378 RepID=G0WBW8_NAUDC|nr:hypothetical protein NDAI_0E04210 [Naumovozyma dairenensis CBS 421]CCD25238.1 hypothetical protein NDAI_0E04210 [Naumovozyma dairenensis CBS 421]
MRIVPPILLKQTKKLVTPKNMTRATKYYDIGLNLTDPMYQGIYNGKKYHESDIKQVLNRAVDRHVKCGLLTGSSWKESNQAIALSHKYGEGTGVKLYYTIGVHPCCVNEFAMEDSMTIDNPTHDEKFNESLIHDILREGSEKNKVAIKKLRQLYELIERQLQDDKERFRAVGEIGLDYDRFHYSSKQLQLVFFEEQLKLSCLIRDPKLSLFLHMRNCSNDFVTILKKFIDGFEDLEDPFNWKGMFNTRQAISYKFDKDRKFVVHSFTGSEEDMNNILNLSSNCYIGMNGCSLKIEENIECAKKIPLTRLLLETDAPWCEIRRTHESFKYLKEFIIPYKSVKRDKLAKLSMEDDWPTTMIKSRNEPCTMEQVATVVANVKELNIDEVMEQVWENSCKIYGE